MRVVGCEVLLDEAYTVAPVDRPPVPHTRRVAPDGQEVLVDLSSAPFGAGIHACPGRELANVIVDGCMS